VCPHLILISAYLQDISKLSNAAARQLTVVAETCLLIDPEFV